MIYFLKIKNKGNLKLLKAIEKPEITDVKPVTIENCY